MDLRESTFWHNIAGISAAIHSWEVTLLTRNSLFIKNRAQGVLYLADCEIMLTEGVRLLNNTGSSLLLFNSNLTLTKPSYIEIANTVSSNGITHSQLGGAITAFQSKIVIYDKCILFKMVEHYMQLKARCLCMATC